MAIVSQEPLRILVLDDEQHQIDAIQENLGQAWKRAQEFFGGCKPIIDGHTEMSDILALLERPVFPYQMVLADLFMPLTPNGSPHEKGGAHRLFEELQNKPSSYLRPLLVITTNRRKEAEELIRQIHEASRDEKLDWVTYLEKPENAPGPDPDRRSHLLKINLWTAFLFDCIRAARDSRFRQTFLRSSLDEVLSFSHALQKLKNDARRYCNAPLILITGEPGSGKERIAQFIHESSTRSGFLLARDSVQSWLPNMMEAELFGAERGSYTGCTERRIGILELADKGTVFLDEFGANENSRIVADKLKRVLSEPRQFYRIGGKELLTFEGTLILCGSSLKEMKRHSLDLFSRLSGLPELVIPPLRDHAEDILPLANHFLRREQRGCAPKSLDSSAEGLLTRYEWPGNIRELENVMRTAAECDPDEITADDLKGIPPFSAVEVPRPDYKDPQQLLEQLIKRNGNREATAKFFEIDPKTLRHQIKKIESEPKFAGLVPRPAAGRGAKREK